MAAYLGALEGALLDEVLVCPGFRELGSLPALIYGQQRHVVALRLKELCLLLVSLGLLLTRAVEYVLCAQHTNDLHITTSKVLASANTQYSTLTSICTLYRVVRHKRDIAPPSCMRCNALHKDIGQPAACTARKPLPFAEAQAISPFAKRRDTP